MRQLPEVEQCRQKPGIRCGERRKESGVYGGGVARRREVCRGRRPPHERRYRPHHGPHGCIVDGARFEGRVQTGVEQDVPHAQRGGERVGPPGQERRSGGPPQQRRALCLRHGQCTRDERSRLRPFHERIALSLDDLIRRRGAGATERRSRHARQQDIQLGVDGFSRRDEAGRSGGHHQR